MSGSDHSQERSQNLPQFLLPGERKDKKMPASTQQAPVQPGTPFELVCTRCGFLLTTNLGTRQWWVETSRGNLCSRCFLVLWGQEGGSADFEIGYIHGLDPIDPEPVLRLWDLVARMIAAWKSGIDVARKMDLLVHEGDSVLQETVVGQVPALQLMEQIHARRAQRYKMVQLRPQDPQ